MPEDKTFYILNGPNLDILGAREPEVYGTGTLAELERLCRAEARLLGFELVFFQSNAEHALIDRIHEAAERSAGIIINPAAFSYSSYAILDALHAASVPIVEVHLSNIHARSERWRARSLISPAADAVLSGLGFEGYLAALRFLAGRQGHGG